MTTINFPIPAGATSIARRLNGAFKGNTAISSSGTHPAYGLIGGSPSLTIPAGFGRGEYAMWPLDAGGKVVLEPGADDHRDLYFGKAGEPNTWDAARIVANEPSLTSTSQVTGTWIKNQPTSGLAISPHRYGEHPSYALDQSLQGAVLATFLRNAGTVSRHIYFQDGYETNQIGVAATNLEGFNGRKHHPILFAGYGGGTGPIITTKTVVAGSFGCANMVFQDIDMSHCVDSPSIGTVKTALEINKDSENWLFNRCDFSGKGVSIKKVNHVTFLSCKLNDSVYQYPTSGLSYWNVGQDDRLQGFYNTDLRGLGLIDNMIVQSGWADGYDDLNNPPDATTHPQPPSAYSHGGYQQDGAVDTTADGNIFAYSSSQGFKFQCGTFAVHNIFFENPSATYFNNANVIDQTEPQETQFYQNIVIGARYKTQPGNQNGLDGGIIYGSGFRSFYSGAKPYLWQNAVLHFANPNSTEPYELGKPATNSQAAYAIAGTLINDHQTYVFGWRNGVKENIAISDAAANQLTMHYFIDDELGVPRGTTTFAGAKAWCKSAHGKAIRIVDFIIGGLGGDRPSGYSPGLNVWTPNPGADGFRWDGPWNWSLKRVPVDGDSVQFNGGSGVHARNISLASIDWGSGATLTRYAGRLTVASMSGTVAITLKNISQMHLSAISGGSATILCDDGQLLLRGNIASGLSVTAQGEGYCIIESGRSVTIGSGRTLSVKGANAKVGFDGPAGTSTLTIASGGTLAFDPTGGTGLSTIKVWQTGKSGKDAYNRIIAPAVTGNVVLAAGATVTVDKTGLAAGTYTLIDAASLTNGGASLPAGVAVSGNKLILTV